MSTAMPSAGSRAASMVLVAPPRPRSPTSLDILQSLQPRRPTRSFRQGPQIPRTTLCKKTPGRSIFIDLEVVVGPEWKCFGARTTFLHTLRGPQETCLPVLKMTGSETGIIINKLLSKLRCRNPHHQQRKVAVRAVRVGRVVRRDLA